MYFSIIVFNYYIPNAVKFNLDSQFTLRALSRLEAAGLTVTKALGENKDSLASVIGIDIPTNLDSSTLLKVWLEGSDNLRPTWRHLLWALREIILHKLADQCEALLIGRTTVDSDLNSHQDVEGLERKEEGQLCYVHATICNLRTLWFFVFCYTVTCYSYSPVTWDLWQ